MSIKINVINKSTNNLPEYAKQFDAGMDLRADFTRGVSDKNMSGAAYDEVANVIHIFSGGRCIVPTGIFTAIPPGYEVQVRSRSGLAIKYGIIVLNSPGTVDSGYRNEWGVILMNCGDEVFTINQGDRIAQAVLAKVEQIEWNEVESLSDSDRGESGFGKSGIK